MCPEVSVNSPWSQSCGCCKSGGLCCAVLRPVHGAEISAGAEDDDRRQGGAVQLCGRTGATWRPALRRLQEVAARSRLRHQQPMAGRQLTSHSTLLLLLLFSSSYLNKAVVGQCLLQASFGGGEVPPSPPKNLQFPLLWIFFSAGTCDESRIHHGNILLVDIQHRKLLVIKLPQGCKFMPKMHHNTFGGRRGPAGRAYPLPRPRSVTTYFTFLR